MAFLIVIIAVFFAVFEIASFAVYGLFVNDTKTCCYLLKIKDRIRLNQFDNKIISMPDGTYITNTPFSIFSKWHISDYGTVPRWSKAHRLINKYHADLLFSSRSKEEMVFGIK